MSADGDGQRRGTRLYAFPGGVFERWDDSTDDSDPGVYIEFHQSCNDAREFGPGEGLADDEPEPFGNVAPFGEPISDRTRQ
jgi:hypothetical protein